MDVLDDILGSLRLTGGVVIDGEFSGDFCVRAEFGPDHFAPFFPEPETLISYHYVRSGRLVVEVAGMPPVELEAGSIAILPRNDPHTLASRSGLPPADVSDIRRVTAEGVHHLSSGTDGPKAEIWCGFLGAAKVGEHPLLGALPPLLTLDAQGGEAEWLESSMRFLAEQQPSSEVVARLAELFLGQAIREYIDRLPTGAKGWMRGLADPAVSKALSIIHSRYAEDLDVAGLAREVGISRSVLGERFVELLGEPPMRYCARWRMRVAANMLRDTKENTANIAFAVGFNSEAAFNRAFKREFGMPPATWRRQLGETPEAATPARGPAAARPETRRCTAVDGTDLAFAVSGEGPPLVKVPNWFNHLERDWAGPVWGEWFDWLSRGHRFLRYDGRGHGASGRSPALISPEGFAEDLQSVVEAAEFERFDLLGVGHGATVALRYAARHPERVRKLVLLGGWALGWKQRHDAQDLARRQAIVDLSGIGWELQTSIYRDLYTKLYAPGANDAQVEWLNQVQRDAATAGHAVAFQNALGEMDIRDLLPEVRAPALLLHAKRDHAVPLWCSEDLISGLRDATFVTLDSENHVLLPQEREWPRFQQLVEEFLGS